MAPLNELLLLLCSLCFLIQQSTASNCDLANTPCPYDPTKIQICHHDDRFDIFETRCVYPATYVNRHQFNAKHYCGACSVEDDPTRGRCTVAQFPCAQGGAASSNKLQFCQYDENCQTTKSFSTQCLTQDEYDLAHGSGANSNDYCGPCREEDEEAGCHEEFLIDWDDFESYPDVYAMADAGWVNAKWDHDVYFTTILGRYNSADDPPMKSYVDLPTDLDYLIMSFAFLEIDDWDKPDSFTVLIDGEAVNLGFFDREVDEKAKNGYTENGLTWFSYAPFTPHHIGFNYRFVDQIHRVKIRIPASFIADGELKVCFHADLNAAIGQESAGIDDYELMGYKSCGGCVEKQIVQYENFESYTDSSQLLHWKNAKLETSGGSSFTKFLGRYDNEVANSTANDPSIVYNVPHGAQSVLVEFDFYEIDQWEGEDCLLFFINGEVLDLGFYSEVGDEGYRTDTTWNLITWTVDSKPNPPTDLGFGSFADQVHHVSAFIPHFVFSSDGEVELSWGFRLNDALTNESGGIDNVKVTAEFDCGECMPSKLVSFEDFGASTAPGWINAVPSNGLLSSQVGSELVSPRKIYFAPLFAADYLYFEFDFIPFGGYSGSAGAVINGYSFTYFDRATAASSSSGDVDATVIWSRDLEGTIGGDQVHRISAYLPVELVSNATLDVTLVSDSGNSVGYDNVKLTAIFDCGPCTPKFPIHSDNFEGDTPLAGWTNGLTSTTTGYGAYLGRYSGESNRADGSLDPMKTYSVPPSALSVTIEFELLEFDNWNDYFVDVIVNGKKASIGPFNTNKNEGELSGSTTDSIDWFTRNLTTSENTAFQAQADQKHFVGLTVPDSLFKLTGEVKVQFHFGIPEQSTLQEVSAGIDNIDIFANFDCAFPSQAPSFEGNLIDNVPPVFDDGKCHRQLTPCPYDDNKVEICHYDRTSDSHSTLCLYPESYDESYSSNERDYCGACTPEDEPKRGVCKIEDYRCPWNENRIQICHFCRATASYMTKCVTEMKYNMTSKFSTEDYCGHCTNEDEGVCFNEELVAFDGFERYESSQDVRDRGGWVNGYLDYDENFSTVLGRFNGSDYSTYKIFYDVPKDAEYYLVEFEFLEIDDWDYPDEFIAYIDGEKISLGKFAEEVDEYIKNGITPGGITWDSFALEVPYDIGFNENHVDQIHHVVARVPTFFGVDGVLNITFETWTVDDELHKESAAIDNVYITAHKACGTCVDEEVLFYENFESYGSVSEMPDNWRHPKLDSDPGFSQFLGRYANESAKPYLDPRLIIPVPYEADYIRVDMDFYEIDGWEGQDCFHIFINGELLDLNIYNQDVDEGYKYNLTDYFITWTADSSPNPPQNLGFGSGADQKHHIQIMIPYWIYDQHELLEISFSFRLDDMIANEAAGIDNIKVTALYDCALCIPTELVSFEDFQTTGTALDGWVNGKLATSTQLTQYLGGFGKESNVYETDPKKLYFVPLDAEIYRIDFDFYEIDEWKGEDCFYMYINGVLIEINYFSAANDDDDFKEGVAHADVIGYSISIPWQCNSVMDDVELGGVPGAHPDEKHHCTIDVPYHLPTADGGILELHISTRIDPAVGTIETAGFDNIKITAIYDCGPCVPDFLVVKEDFENRFATVGWKNGFTSEATGFTKFLGRYDSDYSSDALSPEKSWKVPPTAVSIEIAFDFYEIDNWNNEEFAMSINGEKFVFGTFSSGSDEGSLSGTTPKGVTWGMLSETATPIQIGYGTNLDQKHKATIQVPPSVYENVGRITVKFQFGLDSKFEVKAGGIDNFEMRAMFDCQFPSAVPSMAPSDIEMGRNSPPVFQSPPIGGPPIAPPPVDSCPTYLAEVDCGDSDGMEFYVNEVYGFKTCEWLRTQSADVIALACPTEACTPAFFYCPQTCGRCCVQ